MTVRWRHVLLNEDCTSFSAMNFHGTARTVTNFTEPVLGTMNVIAGATLGSCLTIQRRIRREPGVARMAFKGAIKAAQAPSIRSEWQVGMRVDFNQRYAHVPLPATVALSEQLVPGHAQG